MCYARASVTWSMETSTSLLQYAFYTWINNLDCHSMHYTRASVAWNMETNTPLLQYAIYACIGHLHYGKERSIFTVCVIHVHQSPTLRAGTDPDPLPTCM